MDIGLPPEVAAHVAQGDAVVLPLPVQPAGLGQIVLDLKQIREVGVEEEGDFDLDLVQPVVGELKMLP